MTKQAVVEADLSTSAKATVDRPKRGREGGQIGLYGIIRKASSILSEPEVNSIR
jgi:hypothetical protein